MKKTLQFYEINGKVLLKRVFILLILSMSANIALASSFFGMQTKSFNIKDATVKEAIKQVLKDSKYNLIYSVPDVEMAKKITLVLSNITEEEALNKIMKDTGLTYSVKDNNVVISKAQVNQQKVTIKGKVIESDGKNPIAGATVLVVGTADGAITDEKGAFTLSVKAGAEVEASFLGMIAVKRKFTTSEDNVIFSLNKDVIAVDDVVVVGYGTTKRKDMTGSVAVIGAEEIGKVAQNSTVHGMLQGRVAGTSVQIQSASPTSPISVIIRGQSSLSGNNQPLWVIDGVPDYSSATSGSVANTLYNLNLDDVESVTVLKDASGTAIYGSRAANGVIIVTTKSGKKYTKPEVTFSANVGIQTFDYNGLNFMSGKDYIDFTKSAVAFEVETMGALDYFTRQYVDEAYFKTFRTSEIDRTLISYGKNSSGQQVFYDSDTDWQREISQNPVFQNYDLSLRGGNETTSYYVSMFYKGQKGVVKTGFSDTFGGRVNLETTVADRIKFGINLDGSYRKTNDRDDMLDRVRQIRPDIPVYNEDGTYFRRDSYTQNPFQILENTKNGFGNQIRITPFVEFKILDNLRFKVSPSLSYAESKYLTHTTRSEYEGIIAQNSRSWSNNENLTKAFETTLTYNKLFGKHDILAIGGYSLESNRTMVYSMAGSNFPDDYVLNTMGNASVKGSLRESTSENRLMSYFGRVQYKYFDRYLLTATIRRDGSSRFGPNNRWGTFPSVGAGWIITEESFMKPFAKTFTMLKLRASYGQTGSQNLGNYGFYPSTSGGTYNGSPSTYPSSMANPNLRWEKSTMFDLGLDYGLFEERLRGSFGVYRRRTDDLIYNMPVPSSSSYSSVSANIGSTENKGIEFDFTFDVIKTRDHILSVNGNIAKGVNKVLKFDGMIESLYFSGGSSTTAVTASTYMRILSGGNLNTWYGYDYNRLYYTAEEARAVEREDATGQKITYHKQVYSREGDTWLKDQNGDGEMNVDDMVELGSAEPKFFGGFGLNYIWKGLNVNAVFSYAFGHKRYWALTENAMQSGNYNQTNKLGGNSAHLVGASESAMPNSTPYDYINNAAFNSRFLYDASYIRLSNFNVSYRLPKSIYKGTSIVSAIEFTFAASNLFTLTKYPGMDPQGNWGGTSIGASLGVDYGTYPSARTFNFGVKLTFK